MPHTYDAATTLRRLRDAAGFDLMGRGEPSVILGPQLLGDVQHIPALTPTDRQRKGASIDHFLAIAPRG